MPSARDTASIRTAMPCSSSDTEATRTSRRPDRMASFGFDLLKADGGARLGRLRTAHGEIDTPAFMPVASQGSVKGLTPSDLTVAGAQILLANTYHLFLRPGHEVVRELGGLHRLMGWN